MHRLIVFVLTALVALPAQARLSVFACEPEWASLVEELAGARASVFTATSAQQDPHRIQARPALIARLRQAQLLVCTGADLEAGWLPLLQRRANNPRVQTGAPGYFEAADAVTLLDRPTRHDRADGDIHAAGNPHLHLDPRNIAAVARALSERLIRLDPAGADAYRERHEAFQSRWQAAIERWQAAAAPLRGTPVIVAHRDWRYLENWLGLEPVAALEPKPGVPPGSAHLAEVLAIAERREVPMVLYAAYQQPRAARWLAERSPAKALELPYTVGGSAAAGDLFGLFDDTLRRLLDALE